MIVTSAPPQTVREFRAAFGSAMPAAASNYISLERLDRPSLQRIAIELLKRGDQQQPGRRITSINGPSYSNADLIVQIEQGMESRYAETAVKAARHTFDEKFIREGRIKPKVDEPLP